MQIFVKRNKEYEIARVVDWECFFLCVQFFFLSGMLQLSIILYKDIFVVSPLVLAVH